MPGPGLTRPISAHLVAKAVVLCSPTQYAQLVANHETAGQNIGVYIRQRVIPEGVSVTEAARRLGVGRPTLSNLLNGKASLSLDMAFRLETTFGADRQELLNHQAALDRASRRDADREIAAGRFVPPFLAIKARDIEAWANRIETRELFAVLLRTLVHSTGDGLRWVDFPGRDNAQRPGWDGWVESDSAAPWIPHGDSGWEFGVSGDPLTKAEDDYGKRVSSTPAAERARLTFVFVTPRNWPQKKAWVTRKGAAGDWKEVRALDADDLEQWIEQSLVGQILLADQLDIPTRGCTSLDRFWEQWRTDSEPAITERMFAPSVALHLTAFTRWLEKPGGRPLTVAADSTGEAVAFLACLLRHPDVSTQAQDRAVLVDCAETIRILALSTSPFIPVVRGDETEQELGPVYRRFPCIVVRPRNAVERPAIELAPLGYDEFRDALVDMSFAQDDMNRLARESGRSPTILRRRLSEIPAIRTPSWAKDREVARSLIPIALLGAWHKGSMADCSALSALSGYAYDEVEQSVAHMRTLDDPPVWCVGQFRGVASKIDALFAISGSLTERDLKDFLEVAERVLSETEPTLTLPDDQRWAADIFGKVRNHSAKLRSGIGDTLAMLAVHGNDLFRNYGIDVELPVVQLIKRLLSPLTAETLLSHQNDLPLYAEAAPTCFLQLVGVDLKKPNPAVLQLLTPAGDGLFAPPRRIGLLRGLACVAWSPQFLPQVVCILARLAETDIDDHWYAKPFAMLAAIFHSWRPQTAASLDDRVRCLKMTIDRFPEVGWRLCVDQLRPGSTDVSNQRPRWRADSFGFGRGVPEDEERAFRRTALDLAFGWQAHDQNTLGDLVGHLDVFSAQDQERLWELVECFAQTATDDRAKAVLREGIIRYAFSGMRSMLGIVADDVRAVARAACDKLAPHDPVFRHGWLFSQQEVAGLDFSADDHSNDIRHQREQVDRAHRCRSEAMADIWAKQGWQGVTRLLANSDAPEHIGRYVAALLTEISEAVTVLRTCLSSDALATIKLDGFMRGLLAAFDESERGAVLSAGADGVDNAAAARLFRCAPLGEHTWRALDRQAPRVRECYWHQVPVPGWWQPTGLAELLSRLLDAKRSRCAFHAARQSWKHIETALLTRLLHGLTDDGNEPSGSYQIDPHEVSLALDELERRVEITSDEMARLEWTFVPVLCRLEEDRWHGIPNLERLVSESPPLFAHAVALRHERNDGSQDPLGWSVDDPEREQASAGRASHLLQRLRRMAGADDDGIVHVEPLDRWCREVRRLCAEYGRAGVGDIEIGQLLSHAPATQDGTWPCQAVCEVMESIGSSELRQGFQMGVYNARGVHCRGVEEGGDQERDLAASWRSRAQRLAFDYPFVSTTLDEIATQYEREGASIDIEVQAWKRTGH